MAKKYLSSSSRPRILDGRARMVLYGLAPYFAEVLATVSEILRVSRPLVVVVEHEASAYAIAFLLLSRTLPYPLRIVALQYELVYPGCLHDHWRPSSGEGIPRPDVKLASGPWARRVLIEHGGYDPDKVLVTGEPRYDSYAKIDCCVGSPGVLYLPSTSDVEMGSLQPFLRHLPRGTRLTLRPHPNEKHPDRFSKALREFPHAVVDSSGSLAWQLRSHQVVVSAGSSAVMEAILADRPVVLLDYCRGSSPLPFRETGAALHAADGAEAASFIARLQNRRSGLSRVLAAGRERFIKEYLYRNDGQAGLRVARAILKTI